MIKSSYTRPIVIGKENNMYCRKCGRQIPDDSLFCPKCGKKVILPENEGTPAETHTARPPEPVQKNEIPHDTVFSPVPVFEPPSVQESEPDPWNFSDPDLVESARRGFGMKKHRNIVWPVIDMPMKWYGFMKNVVLPLGVLSSGVDAFTALVYEQYALALAMAAVTVLQVIICNRLANYRKNAPMLVVCFYAVMGVINSIGALCVLSIEESFGMIQGAVIGITAAVINGIYFRKRKHLFIN